MNRAAVKRRINTLAASFFTDEPVDVSYALDTEARQQSKFELGPAEGETTEDSVDGTLQTDRFTVAFRIETHGHRTTSAAEEEVERLYNLFADGLMAHRNLNHPDPAWSDRDLDIGVIQTAVIGTVNGPRATFPGGGQDMAWVEGSIAVTTALAFQED